MPRFPDTPLHLASGCGNRNHPFAGMVSVPRARRDKKRSNIMNQLINKPGIALSPTLKASLRNRFSRSALAFLVLLILASITTVPAKASGCNGLGGGGNFVKYPMPDHDGAAGPDSVVGLWHVVYTTTGGAPFGVSFKEWHSDGTE